MPKISQSKKWLILSSFFLFLQVYSYIAIVNNKEISEKEFQDYINVKKFIASKKSIETLTTFEKKTKQQMLNEFVDHKIILFEANKKGFSASSKLVKEEFNKTKKQWIHELYTSLQKKPEEVQVTEQFVKQFFTALPQAKQKKYEDLLPQEKQQLYQLATLKKKKDTDDILKKKLEKKYKVKRYGPNKKVSAIVVKHKVLQKTIEKIFVVQLQQLGLTPELLKEKDSVNYHKAKKEVMERLIFEKLIELDIARNKFSSKKNTRNALKLYKEKIVLNTFINKVVAQDTPVSDQEMDRAFQYLSRSNPQIQKMLPSEQEKFLRRAIIQQKLPQILNSYLIEKKEAIIIKKNRKALEKIS